MAIHSPVLCDLNAKCCFNVLNIYVTVEHECCELLMSLWDKDEEFSHIVVGESFTLRLCGIRP